MHAECFECVVCYETTHEVTGCCGQSLCGVCAAQLQMPTCPNCRHEFRQDPTGFHNCAPQPVEPALPSAELNDSSQAEAEGSMTVAELARDAAQRRMPRAGPHAWRQEQMAVHQLQLSRVGIRKSFDEYVEGVLSRAEKLRACQPCKITKQRAILKAEALRDCQAHSETCSFGKLLAEVEEEVRQHIALARESVGSSCLRRQLERLSRHDLLDRDLLSRLLAAPLGVTVR